MYETLVTRTTTLNGLDLALYHKIAKVIKDEEAKNPQSKSFLITLAKNPCEIPETVEVELYSLGIRVQTGQYYTYLEWTR